MRARRRSISTIATILRAHRDHDARPRLNAGVQRPHGNVLGLIEESPDDGDAIFDRQRIAELRRLSHQLLDLLAHDHELAALRRLTPAETLPLRSVSLRDE